MTRFMLFLWIALLTVVVLTGVLSHNIWVSVLSGTGLVILTGGYRLLNHQVAKTKSGFFLVEMVVGLSLLGGATWLSQLEGRWIWAAAWLLAAFPVFVAGCAMFRKVAMWRVALTLAVSGVAALFAIVSPFLMQGDFTSQRFLGWLLLWLFLFIGPVLFLALRSLAMRDVRVIRLAFTLLLGLAIIAGFATRIIWVPFLIVIGLLLLYKNQVRLREGALFQYRRYLLEALAGVALLAVATALARLQTWWLWSSVWVLAGVPLLFTGAELYSEGESDQKGFRRDRVPAGMVWSGGIALVLGAFSLLLALVGPFMLAQMEGIHALLTFALVATGLLLVLLAWSEAGADHAGRFAALAIGGTLLCGAASLYCSFAGAWVWMVLWLGGAILLAAAARALHSRAATLLAAGLALLHFLVAFAGPTFGLQYLATIAPTRFTPQPVHWTDFLTAVGIFAAIAVAAFGLYILSLIFQAGEAGLRARVEGGTIDPEMMNTFIRVMMEMEESEDRKKR